MHFNPSHLRTSSHAKLLGLCMLTSLAGGAPWVANAAVTGTAPELGHVYLVTNVGSERCLDIPSGSKASGATVQQWGCHATTAWQNMRVSAPDTSGRVQLITTHANLCLSANGNSATAPLSQTVCSASASQLWTLVSAGTRVYQLKNAASGLCMSNKAGIRNSGNPIVQEACASNTRMQWAFALQPRAWPATADGFASLDALGQSGTTGGAGGTTVTVSNQEDLVRYAGAAEPYIIKVSGTITIVPKGLEVKVASNKSIVGVGTTGEIAEGGFFLGQGVHNVIIRNLTIRDTFVENDPNGKCCDFDAIQMDGAHHVWIDHNRLTHMNDGLIDSRKDTTNLTVSWNILSNHNKAFGIGWTDNVTAEITVHHNWLQNTNQRNPSADNVLHAHLYNNFMQNIASYGNLSRGKTQMVLENSYFDTVLNPFYPDTLDAQLVQRGSIVVNSTGKQATNGTAFDPRAFYPYALDTAADVPSLLKRYAGPQANID
jgi:pectate lyase